MSRAYRTHEVAARLGYSVWRVRALARQGLLPARKVHLRGDWRFPAETIDAMVRLSAGERNRTKSY